MTFSYKRFLNLPKPTKEDFRGDRERILDALNVPDASMTMEALRSLYPLTARADYAVTVTLCPGDRGTDIIRVEPGDTTHRLLGLALDIGSTTLEMELVDMLTGQVLRNVGCVNSQVSFGLNILDRILAVKENRENLEALRLLVTGDINRLIEEVTAGLAEPEEISALTVGGNTTMIHFFLGCDPWLVFQNPYAPVFFDPGIHSARELGLNLCCNVFCFPAKANYLGGDITAGLLLTDLDTGEKPSVFLDIGTNGEMALGGMDGFTCCAVAAGPAFEGAGIACGMLGVDGAVSRVRYSGAFKMNVIGGGEAAGLCGSGLIDLTALLLRLGVIDEGGRLLPPEDAPEAFRRYLTRDENGCGVFHLTDRVYLTAADVRALQLAKAAVAAGVQILLAQQGLTLSALDGLYLSGGFGMYLDPASAAAIGMLPRLPAAKLHSVGNAALSGAAQLALRGDMSAADGIVNRLTYLELSGRPDFADAFAKNIPLRPMQWR